MSALPPDAAGTSAGTPAASLYDGHVMHHRLRPRPHRFRYRVFSLLIDLDRLEEAGRLSPLFSVNRGNLASFHEADHGRRDGTSLAEQACLLAREAGIACAIGKVALLCYPRIFGYVFNPLSVYYLHDVEGALVCLLYEVRNTFAQRHIYVAPIREGELGASGLRQARDKLLYVSPFIDMAMRYEFYLKPPADTVFLRILERDRDGPLLLATFAGARRAVSTGRLLDMLVAVPALTFKIIGAIHWEALRLWLKGIRLVARPAPPAATSCDASGAFSATQHGSDAPAIRRTPLLIRTPHSGIA